jgi:hypothetical protein
VNIGGPNSMNLAAHGRAESEATAKKVIAEVIMTPTKAAAPIYSLGLRNSELFCVT